ncbi:MAG: hypothetical protein N3F66_10565 [Spirochaetes bacterium]|nr:hypothetical protein [Spirochaetota bacterium]
MQKILLDYKIYYILVLILFIAVMLSCTSGQNVSSLSNLDKDDVILVGKVILDPPLHPNEYTKIISIKGSTGYVYLYYSTKVKPIESLDIGLSQISNSIKTENAKTFYVKFKNQPLYFYYGFVLMDIDTDSGNDSYAYLPAGWVVNPQSNDKAVYIGTIKYYRDEFFRITKVDIIDEYDNVSKEFYEKYGNTIPLKKSLLKSM